MSEEERGLSREFEVHFVLAVVYDGTFREYVFSKLNEDFLKEWDTKYLYGVAKKLWTNKKPVNLLALYEHVKMDYILSDDKLKEILSLIEPFLEDLNNAFLKSVTAGVIGRTEVEVSKSLMLSAILKAKIHYDQRNYKEIPKLFQEAEDNMSYNPTMGMLFWKNIIQNSDLNEWKAGIPLCVFGKNHNENLVWADDVLFYEGIGRGQICFFQGDSSLGKTTLLQNIAVAQTLRGYNVDYYSLEMPYDYIVYRTSSILTGIPTNDVRKDPKVFEHKLVEICEKYPEKGDLCVYDIESRNVNPSSIRYNVRMSEKEGRKVDCVCIDYIDIMSSGREFRDKRHEIGYNTQAMRDLGKELDLAVISPTKQNRAKSKSPDRSRIAEDYSKVYTSDLLIVLSVEEVKDNYGNEDKIQMVKFFMDKNRYGDSGITFALFNDRITGRFFDPFNRIEKLRK